MGYVSRMNDANSGLFPNRQLFGEDENATGELDDAEKQGENGRLPFVSSSTSQP